MKSVKLTKQLKSEIVNVIVARSAQKKALEQSIITYHETGYSLMTEMYGGVDALKFVKEKIEELKSLASKCFDAGIVNGALSSYSSIYAQVKYGSRDIENYKNNGASSDFIDRLIKFKDVHIAYQKYYGNYETKGVYLESARVPKPDYLDNSFANINLVITPELYDSHPEACSAFVDALMAHSACFNELQKFEKEMEEFVGVYNSTGKLIQDVPDLAPIVFSCLPKPTATESNLYPMVLAQKVTTSLLDAGVIPVEQTEEEVA